MLGNFIFDAIFGALLIAGWYFWARRLNHRRSVQILRWIDCALCGSGCVSAIRWRNASLFDVDIRLRASVFRRVSLAVQLAPWGMPLNWLLNRMRKAPETVTFQAVLDYPRAKNLYLQNHRWSGRTCRVRPASWDAWHFESLGPVVMSTGGNWQRDVEHILQALLATRSCDFLRLELRSEAPHFVACAPLESLRPEASGSAMFEVLHELASSVSSRAR
jgi:hypothetical protein